LHDLMIHPDGTQLALLDYDNRVHRYDLRSATREPLLAPANFAWDCLHFLGQGRWLTFPTAEDAIGIWDCQTRSLVRLSRPFAPSRRLTITRDQRWGASLSAANRVVLFDLESGKEVLQLPPESSTILSLKFSPDGRRLALGLSDGGVVLWNLEQVRAELAA